MKKRLLALLLVLTLLVGLMPAALAADTVDVSAPVSYTHLTLPTICSV